MTTSERTRSGAWRKISTSAWAASGTAITSYPREASRSCIRLIVLGLSSTTRIRGRRRRADGSLAPCGARKEIADNFLGKSIPRDKLLLFYCNEKGIKTQCDFAFLGGQGHWHRIALPSCSVAVNSLACKSQKANPCIESEQDLSRRTARRLGL